MARRVLKRIDGMSETAYGIMEGDLKGRLAITGTGDEMDRLFDDFGSGWPTVRFSMPTGLLVPAVEMTETKKAYAVRRPFGLASPAGVEPASSP